MPDDAKDLAIDDEKDVATLETAPDPPVAQLRRRGKHHEHDDSHEQAHHEHHHDHGPAVLPVLYQPPRVDAEHERSVWLVPGSEMTDWLCLFYDLSVVAILSTFSNNLEIKSAPSVGIFFSYFIIAWWIWVSQTVFDIRVAADDYFNRLAKLLQTCVFIYVGAGSTGWNPLAVSPVVGPCQSL